MPEKDFLKATDIAEKLNISPSTAYRIIKKLNKDREKNGKSFFAGRISRRYFEEIMY